VPWAATFERVLVLLVPMMRQAFRFSYAEGADYQAARPPYGGEAADMLIIPPDEGGSGRVEERLGAALLDEVRGNLPETQVGLTMSRFGFETDLTFIDLPEGLSLRPPFGPYEALLSGVTKEERPFIHGALHKATITVDEKGTGAASAILDMPVSGGGGPETTTPDRPRSPSLFRSGRRVRYCSSVGSSAG
jgi:serine protease inhibitor